MFHDSLLQFLGKEVELVIREHKKTRSNRQNAYYWGVVVAMIAEQSGNRSPRSVHEDLSEYFGLKEERENIFGEVSIITVSTTRYNTKQFEEYLEKLRLFALDFYGINIPLPNEVDIPDFYTTY